MGFTVPKVPIIIASVCLLLALIFQLVGIAGPAWLVAEGPGSKYETGIFRSCAEVSGVSDCASTTAPADWWKAVQAFAILGLLALIGAMVLAVLHFFKEDAGFFSLIAAIVSAVAAFCILIEFAVFIGKVEDEGVSAVYDYGYAFILTIIACVASLAAAILFCVGKSSSS